MEVGDLGGEVGVKEDPGRAEVAMGGRRGWLRDRGGCNIFSFLLQSQLDGIGFKSKEERHDWI